MSSGDTCFSNTETIRLEVHNEAAITILPIVSCNANALIFREPNNISFSLITKFTFSFTFCAAALFHRTRFRRINIRKPKFELT